MKDTSDSEIVQCRSCFYFIFKFIFSYGHTHLPFARYCLDVVFFISIRQWATHGLTQTDNKQGISQSQISVFLLEVKLWTNGEGKKIPNLYVFGNMSLNLKFFWALLKM